MAQGTSGSTSITAWATVELLLPPLRERKEDIAALVSCFLTEFRGEVGPRELSPEALAACVEYPWPGNIRELRKRDPARRHHGRSCPPAPGSAAAVDERWWSRGLWGIRWGVPERGPSERDAA